MLHLRALGGGARRRCLAPAPHGGSLRTVVGSRPRVQCRQLHGSGARSPTYPPALLGVSRTPSSIEDSCLRKGRVWVRSLGTPTFDLALFTRIVRTGDQDDPEELKLIVREHIVPEHGRTKLAFNFMHCAIWLNKWSKVDPRLLKGKAPPEVLQVLARARNMLRARPQGCRSKYVAIAANALCKLDYDSTGERDAVMHQMAKWCMSQGLADFQPQGLGMLVNAFAKLNAPPPAAVLELICRRCEETELRDFNPHGLSTLINGLSKMNHNPGEALLKMLCQRCEEMERQFTPQGLVTLINGLAKMGYHPGEALLQRLCTRCEEMGLDGFTPQGLSLLINGLARFNHNPGEALLRLLCKRCEQMELRGFDSQSLCMLINGLTKLAFPPQRSLLELLCLRIQEIRLERFEEMPLTLFVNGFAALRFCPGREWLSAVARYCSDRGFAGLTAKELGLLVHALAQLGAPVEDAFFPAFNARASRLGWDTFDEQALSLSLWALAVVERPAAKGLLRAAAAELRRLHAMALQPSNAANEAELDEAVKLNMTSMQYLYLQDPSSWGAEEQALASAAQAFQKARGGVPAVHMVSKLQKGVAAALRNREYTVEEEVPLAEGWLSVDVAVVLPGGARVAVEVDGPRHFLNNRQDQPTGATVLKRRLLSRARERGEVQAIVSVRMRSDSELKKVDRAVQRVLGQV